MFLLCCLQKKKRKLKRISRYIHQRALIAAVSHACHRPRNECTITHPAHHARSQCRMWKKRRKKQWKEWEPIQAERNKQYPLHLIRMRRLLRKRSKQRTTRRRRHMVLLQPISTAFHACDRPTHCNYSTAAIASRHESDRDSGHAWTGRRRRRRRRKQVTQEVVVHEKTHPFER